MFGVGLGPWVVKLLGFLANLLLLLDQRLQIVVEFGVFGLRVGDVALLAQKIVVILHADKLQTHGLAVRQVGLRRVVQRLGEERNDIASLEAKRGEIEIKGLAAVAHDVGVGVSFRRGKNAVQAALEADFAQAVIIAGVNARLQLEVHRDQGVLLWIGQMDLRRQIMRDGERALKITLRRQPRCVNKRKPHPARFGGEERAAHFLFAGFCQRNVLRGLFAGSQFQRALAQGAVGLEAEFYFAALQRLHGLESVGFFLWLEAGVGRRRDADEYLFQLRCQHHADAHLPGLAGVVLGVREDEQVPVDVVQQLIVTRAAFVKHRQCDRLAGMARRKGGEENLLRLMAGGLDLHDQPLVVRHVRSLRPGLYDLQMGERIRGMIAERIGETRNLRGGNAKHGRQHRGEGEQNPGGAFEPAAQFIGARQSFHRRPAQFGGVIFHRLSRQLPGQRRKGGIAGLGAELEEIDQARAEGRIARLQEAGNMFEAVAAHESQMPGKTGEQAKARDHAQQNSEPPT